MNSGFNHIDLGDLGESTNNYTNTFDKYNKNMFDNTKPYMVTFIYGGAKYSGICNLCKNPNNENVYLKATFPTNNKSLVYDFYCQIVNSTKVYITSVIT